MAIQLKPELLVRMIVQGHDISDVVMPEKVNDDYRYLNPPYDNDKRLFDNLRIYSDRLIEVHTASYPRKVAPADLFGRIKKEKRKMVDHHT